MADEQDKAPSFTIDTPPKRGPGRPRKPVSDVAPADMPKARSASGATPTKDVKEAMATLTSMYNVIGTGLLIAGLPDSMTQWVQQTDALNATNQDALMAAPKLAKYIAGIGSTGGAATLILTNAMAFGTVAMTARAELAAKNVDKPAREPRKPRNAPPQPEPGPPAPPRDPTMF